MIKILCFIKQILLKDNKKKSLILFFFLSIFFCGCDKKYPITEPPSQFDGLSLNDKEKLTSFFNELLFVYGGAYTLFGSNKPITIEPLLYYDAKDFKKIGEYIKNHPDLDVINIDRRLEETWADWKKLSSRHETANYILTEIKLDNFSAKESLLVFINIKNTSKILKQYYDDFKKEVGKDFDPDDVINNINKNGVFWKKIFKNHALAGILLGYGYDNAVLFNRFMTIGDPYVKNLHKNSYPSEDSREKAKYYINDIPFRLPIFVCLDEKQSKELIKKYSSERKKIIKTYKNKDFLIYTLEKLASK